MTNRDIQVVSSIEKSLMFHIKRFNRKYTKSGYDATRKLFFGTLNNNQITVYSPDVLLHITFSKEVPATFYTNLEYVKINPLGKSGASNIKRTIAALTIMDKIVSKLQEVT